MIEVMNSNTTLPSTCSIGDHRVTSLDALMILQATAGTIVLP